MCCFKDIFVFIKNVRSEEELNLIEFSSSEKAPRCTKSFHLKEFYQAPTYDELSSSIEAHENVELSYL